MYIKIEEINDRQQKHKNLIPTKINTLTDNKTNERWLLSVILQSCLGQYRNHFEKSVYLQS